MSDKAEAAAEAPAETIRRAIAEFSLLKLSLTLAAVADGHEDGDPFVLVLDKVTDWLGWAAGHAEACAAAVPYLEPDASVRHALAVAVTYLGEEA